MASTPTAVFTVPTAVFTGTYLRPVIELSFDYDDVHARTGRLLREWVKDLPERRWDKDRKTWVVTALPIPAGQLRTLSPDDILAAAGFEVIGPDGEQLNPSQYARPVVLADSRDGYLAPHPRLDGHDSIAMTVTSSSEVAGSAVWRESERRWLIPAEDFEAWLGTSDGAYLRINTEWLDSAAQSPTAQPRQTAETTHTPMGHGGNGLAYDGSIDGLRGVPITDLLAVDRLAEESLAAVGVESVWDLLHYVPRRYIDLSAPTLAADCAPGEKAAITGTVTGVTTGKQTRSGTTGRSRTTLPTIRVRDEGGTVISCRWFNAAWIARRFAVGQRVIIHGNVETWVGSGGATQYGMSNPLVSVMDVGACSGGGASIGAGMVPVYPASAKAELNTWQVYRAATEAASKLGELADPIPPALLAKRGLVDRGTAYRSLHAPCNPDDADSGRRRLAYDELLRLQLSLLTTRASEVGGGGVVHAPNGKLTDQLIGLLPFPLTGAQTRALAEIGSDLRPDGPTGSTAHSRRPMNRLLQGEVGAGKTVVALLTMLMAVEGNWQAALMAPTEILASQHHAEITERLRDLPVRVELLTNKVTGKRRKDVLAGLANGTVDIVVGMHALLADAVMFHSLGLVVIDEQHRFGVEQRAALRAKGPVVPTESGARVQCAPDVLMAKATPIPRTAVMTVFGDMEVSVLDELPPGRTPIVTTHAPSEDSATSDPEAAPWSLIRAQVADGRQAFVVCPLVSDSETKAATAATTAAEELERGALHGLSIGVVHGKQKPEGRAEVIARFAAGELDVLVATTVIEVGVNVPNATVMVVLGAENFGLAQLHQIRGRVGRGKHAGHCVLVASPETADGQTRIAAMCGTTDGFKLSEVDLRIRGFGTLLGGSQSGTTTDFRVADLLNDTDLVTWAKEDAATITAADPHLARRRRSRAQHRRATGR